MLYAATEEFRAEALADVWLSEGYPFGLAAASLHYWNVRARTKVPALCRMLDGGFPAPFHLPAYGEGMHFTSTELGTTEKLLPSAAGLENWPTSSM